MWGFGFRIYRFQLNPKDPRLRGFGRFEVSIWDGFEFPLWFTYYTRALIMIIWGGFLTLSPRFSISSCSIASILKESECFGRKGFRGILGASQNEIGSGRVLRNTTAKV